MVIYLDSSAIVKLVRPEPESVPLADWLNAQGGLMTTSVLAEIEVQRAVRRTDPARLAAIPAVLAGLGRLEMDPIVRSIAGSNGDTALRSLDAVHLATAQAVRATGEPVTAFVTYDRRQGAAAQAEGFRVEMPERLR